MLLSSKCRPVFPLQVIHVTGRLRIRMALTHSRSVPVQIMGMVVVAHALPPPTINEVRIDCQMFVTRVNMDLKIVYCENRYGWWWRYYREAVEVCGILFCFSSKIKVSRLFSRFVDLQSRGGAGQATTPLFSSLLLWFLQELLGSEPGCNSPKPAG